FIINWVTVYPFQIVFYIVNRVVYITPAILGVPFLHLLGFSSNSPVVSKSLLY
ncbi:hypothetical protein P154DRAFT_445755, partial [Amniculicola lignicola CBS 123094]